MSKFLAFDFETADNGADSACSIGLVRVEQGEIVREAVHMIRPPRERIIYTYIHGLSWEHVKDGPTFGELWPQMAPFFEGVDFVVAHNISFDKRVLEACCAAHGIRLPELRYECSVRLARKWLGIYPTKLSNVCQVLGIELNHHEALSDARACARIVLHARAREQEKASRASLKE